MNRKLLICCLLFAVCAFSQSSEKKVWNLLLANKRAEAQKLFDKDLRPEMERNLDYLILNAFIELESGKINFDDSFVKKFSSFDESNYYLNALLKLKMILDEIQTVSFNDDTYDKIDFMAASPNLKDVPC